MSRYTSSASASHFSISQEDFERESVLKRRRQLSPPRANNSYSSNGSSSIGIRTRSKSKSRAREASLRRLPSIEDEQHFIPLGRPGSTSRSFKPLPTSNKTNTNTSSNNQRRSPSRKTNTNTSSNSQRRSPSRGRKRERSPSPHRYMRTRSKSAARSALEADAKQMTHSKSKSRKRTASQSRSRSRSPSRDRSKRHRSKSKSTLRTADKKSSSRTTSTTAKRRRSPSPVRASNASSSRTTATADRELQRDIERDEMKLNQAKRDLEELEDELAALQKRVDAKKFEVMDLQIVVDGLKKRRELHEQFSRRDSFQATATTTTTTRRDPSPKPTTSRRDPSPEREHARRSVSRRSKRPCIEDEEEEEDDDDDVEIVDPPVKAEDRRERSTSKRPSTAVTAPPKPAVIDQMSDYFWGRVDIAKLLVQPRIRNYPDQSARKGRHLAFNPVQQDVFAVGSDDGGLILWNYARQTQQMAKVVSIAPSSFRKESQCAESMAWSPDGYRLALAFRDPLASMGEFCIVRLHELTLTGSSAPQILPRDRVKSKSTTLHSRGISVIDWVPSGYGDRHGARGVVTAGPDHAVVLWEEHEGQTDYKWRVLHREHRSDVRSICMHSQGNAIYTGALDGTVVRYDMHSQRTVTIMERRKPQISKINAVLENPHNPNLLLVSSVEPSEHNLVLHDLREKYDHSRQKAMTLSYLRASEAKSMSQYIVPRWSPGGFHVSCGSPSGVVNIWDVRVRGPQFPLVLPQQSINVHTKQVLHATWHPRYDAMFSVSNDRTIGLLTFR